MCVVTQTSESRFQPFDWFVERRRVAWSRERAIVTWHDGPPAATKHLTATITPLGWDSHLNCNTHNVDTTQLGSIQLQSLGTGRLTVCRTRFEPDDGYFVLSTPGIYLHSHTLRIGINSSEQDEYTNAPYPCRLMVWTSQGVRYFDLGLMPPPPPKPDPQERITAVLRNCLKAYDQVWKGRFNPKWRIDPPLREEVLHHWDVAVTGLQQGDLLELLSRDGRTLSSVRATRAGAARAVAVVAPAEGEVMIVTLSKERFHSLLRNHGAAIFITA